MSPPDVQLCLVGLTSPDDSARLPQPGFINYTAYGRNPETKRALIEHNDSWSLSAKDRRVLDINQRPVACAFASCSCRLTYGEAVAVARTLYFTHGEVHVIAPEVVERLIANPTLCHPDMTLEDVLALTFVRRYLAIMEYHRTIGVSRSESSFYLEAWRAAEGLRHEASTKSVQDCAREANPNVAVGEIKMPTTSWAKDRSKDCTKLPAWETLSCDKVSGGE